MSFNWFARRVRDPQQLIARRRSALGSCLARMSWLTKEPFSVLKERHAPFLGKGLSEVVTEQQLINAVADLERERNQALEILRAFEVKRVRAKMRGRRSPSAAERRILHW